jgi:hypothetical protein
MPRPRGSPCNGQHVPIYQTWECSGLDVPVDPARPDGRRFTLRLGRLAVLDPTQRKGVLLFIPGGPGAASPRSSAATTARRSMSTSSGVNGMW